MALKIQLEEMRSLLAEVFPQVNGIFEIVSLTEELLVMKMPANPRNVRPGGTISGPALFGLADVGAYVKVMAHAGPEALAVTTNCSIDFMRKPDAERDTYVEARLLKLGRSLAVIDTLIFADGVEKPVARATLTYSLPPKRAG